MDKGYFLLVLAYNLGVLA